jgi:hypothetical protein
MFLILLRDFDVDEIIFDGGGLYLAARHLGNGKIEIFTNWADGSKFGTTKVYEITPVEEELIMNRVGLKMSKREDDGLDITGVN